MNQFSQHDVNRLRETVRENEREPTSRRPERADRTRSVSQWEFVEVTSVTLDDGRYPGKVVLYDAADNAWIDLGDVWVIQAEGGELETGIYPARRTGDANDRPVFVSAYPPLADRTVSGLVSTTAQEFQGDKSFFHEGGGALIVRHYDPPNSPKLRLDQYNADEVTREHRFELECFGSLSPDTYGGWILNVNDGSVGASLRAEIDPGVSPPAFFLFSGSTDFPLLKINHGATTRTGESGTFLGMEFTSGLLTSDNGVSSTEPTGGGLTDGDKGDITVSSSGATWTIDADVVTYAKMQNVSATSRVLGRKTAGAGDTEECTASEVLNFIGSTRGSVLYSGAAGWAILTPGTSGHVLTSNGAGADPSYQASGGGSLSDGDRGDITVSSSGTVWTIDAGVVTYAKMQDVSATSRVIGRKTAGAGDPEELTASEVLDFVGATRGQVIYRGASAWTALATGTAGQFLSTQGAGADPQWQTQTAPTVRLVGVPASSATGGSPGDIAVNATHFHCYVLGTGWRRVATAAF